MGLGSFLKKTLTAPLKLAKGSVQSTGKLLKGDVKGSLKTGLGAGAGFASDMSPIKVGALNRIAKLNQMKKAGGANPMGAAMPAMSELAQKLAIAKTGQGMPQLPMMGQVPQISQEIPPELQIQQGLDQGMDPEFNERMIGGMRF